eukprot:CAMPEP_0178925480 /NCGR_PEP_ID=MMETSP0786-20121207/17938_1 /TAXON_ID=186022 /ORGANISM="Thalassionema frauenfeldii, Strain CCMP 1798" /LENGTH=321 /DNA_ID=CAMNT_0020600371 /DNA_START=281 /DNA_END=1246 /DNA_ORIENTATION=+
MKQRGASEPKGKGDIDKLLSWGLLENTMPRDSVSIGPSTISTSSGNGLFVTKSLQRGETILTVPSDKIISIENAWDDANLGDAFMYLTDVGGPGAKLATLAGFVAKEASGGIANIFQGQDDSPNVSDWQPYLDCLPRAGALDHHVLFWSHEKVERLLQGSNIYDEVISMRDQVDLATENIKAIFWNHYQETTYPTDGNDLDEEKVDEAIEIAVRSAFCILLSRAFEDEEVDCMKLIPLLDMTQHSSQNANIRHWTDPATGNVLVTAKRDLQAGEELFNCYSDTLKPQQFFSAFGFVPIKSSLSVIELLESKNPVFFPIENG